MTSKKNQTKIRQFVDVNPVESIRDLGRGVSQSLANDLGKDGVADLWNQLVGEQIGSSQTKGELEEGKELNLATLKNQKSEAQTEKPRYLDIEPGIDYRREILHGEQKIARENSREIKVNIEEIIIELRKLVGASQELQITFKEAVVEQRIEKPGTYHENFFTWLLATVKQARMKVEDSGAWLSALKSKKKNRQYWSMFKKHGTTFGLSGERTVATQTG